MAENESEAAGSVPIDYIEIPVTDVEAAKAFYGELFGWRFEDFGDRYSGFQHAKGFGGFQKRDRVTRGGALVVLYAEDLDAMLERVKAGGAEITDATQTFPGGRRFTFLDPSGNELGVWSDDRESWHGPPGSNDR